MFSYIMRQQDICIGLLESFFPGKKIRRTHYIPANGKDEPADETEATPESNTPDTQKVIAEIFGKRGVRLDVYLELLRYMNSVADFPVSETQNELIHKIDRAVDIAKQSDEWRRAHMNYLLQQRDAEKKGREEQIKLDAIAFYKNNVPLEVIARSLHRSIEVVKQWVSTPSVAPEAS